MGAIKAEDFTVAPYGDGSLTLQCCYYAKGCWWEQPFGVYTGISDDLGSLLAAARVHLDTAHPTKGDTP